MEAKLDELRAIAWRRLHPSLSDPNYIVLRSRRIIFSRLFRRLQPCQLTVLDIGGRYQPYRPLIENRISKYVAIDLMPTALVNVMASGEQLPFPENSFDLVIAAEVFQYFARPDRAASEIYRVLKPGGALCMSVPSFAPRFVDEERWRFTRTGVQALFSLFSSIEIVPEVFSAGGFLRVLNLSLNTFSKFAFLRAILRWTAIPLINLAALAVESAAFSHNDQFTGNYSVCARKNT